MSANIPPKILEHIDRWDDIRNQSDRGAAIVAFAYLDETLERLLKSIMHDPSYKQEKVQSRLFRGSGPLATFIARARLGLVLGLFGRKTFADLVRLAEIRNEFAHKPSRRRFSTQKITDLCSALHTFSAHASDQSATDPRGKYLFTIGRLIGLMHDEITRHHKMQDPPDFLP